MDRRRAGNLGYFSLEAAKNFSGKAAMIDRLSVATA
jgi:hypothetical protein